MISKLNLSIICCFCFSIIARTQNIAPTLTATGNQAYCPNSEINIVTDFTIDDPDDTEIEALYIQISEGYEMDDDILILSGTHPNIVATWDVNAGKLTLKSSNSPLASYTSLIEATKAIIFKSTSNNPRDKVFSITIGDANYLPSTNHYYEYIDDLGVTWTEAKNLAQTRTYFGLQGYLATITTVEEAQLVGEQAAGAGWIGGSDAENEGEWKWVTGPENGLVFWYGQANGTSPNYAFWNNGEPNNVGNEDYAHITSPGVGIPGSWNDLSNEGNDVGDYQPKGYIVEYGGMPGDPELNISTSTSIYVSRISYVEDSTKCGTGILELKAFSELESAIVYWFESEESQTPIFTGNTFETPLLATTTVYYVLASENNCFEGIKTPVNAVINEEPNYNSEVVFKNCDVDGTADGFTFFNLEESIDIIVNANSSNLDITFFKSFNDADANINAIENSIIYNNNEGSTVYARILNNNGCAVFSTINLETSTTNFPEDYMYNFEVCDDQIADGFYTFDLTEAAQDILQQFPVNQNLSVHYFKTLIDAQLEENEILPQNNYTNEISFSQTLFVRVESEGNGGCYGIGEYLQLKVQPKPKFNVEQSNILCLNDGPVELYTENATGDFNYEWTNEFGDVVSTSKILNTETGGTYTVVATSQVGCQSLPVNYTVNQSVAAIISEADITIEQASNNNSITINNENNRLGIGNYEFAINDENNYQDTSRFSNLRPGQHKVFVRDKNGCGVFSLDIFILGFPKFFTPNNDGLNDTWKVEGMDDNFSNQSTVYIYNRYGMLIKQLNAQLGIWDGTFKGEFLPNSDYWFVAKLIEKTSGNIKTYRGHFSLLR
ncbi:T9SS type B sorting domain-containing protein [Neotamlana sedimentorum]|uniref:T9SS type B sorting domain-containing protein n=1 Tax=Neotamlana sedimentorum TaxID=1435349 RepID=UPI00069A1E2B|nr:T9SS type B sorting domain-containing protein [Tamlana sedimentorum]